MSLRKVCMLLAINVLVLSGSGVAEAGWLSSFTGYSAFKYGDTDGFVSFAVWDRGETLSDDLSLPNGTIQVWNSSAFQSDNSFVGRYIYFYQVVNAQTGTQSLKDFRINDIGFIQIGYLDGFVFSESIGNVTYEVGKSYSNVLNAALDGSLSSPSSGGDSVDGIPTFSGYTGVGLSAASFSVVAPTGMTFGNPKIYTQWNFRENEDPKLVQDASSPILFATSNLGPSYREAQVRDGSVATLDVPATPEPGTVVGLLGAGMSAGVIAFLRRSRKKAS